LTFPRLLALKGCADSMPPESLLVPCVVQIPTCRLSMLTTLNRFDAPQDITPEELRMQLFYPTHEATEQWLSAAGQ
jgi:hypothetical protein